MKTLLILRHADAAHGGPNQPDHQRPLTPQGQADAARLGRWLAEADLWPALILASTATRVRQTVAALLDASPHAPPTHWHPALYLAPPPAYIEALAAQASGVERVMVVGHNPGLSELVEQLTGRFAGLPTTGLAVVELPIEQWAEAEVGGQLRQRWSPRE